MAREEYIRIYRSDVVGATPSLTSGEIAANLVDGKFFIGGTNGSLLTFYSGLGVTGITSGGLFFGQTGTNGIHLSGTTGSVTIQNTGVRALTVQGYASTTTPEWYQKGPQIRASNGISVVAGWDNSFTLEGPFVSISNTGILTVNGVSYFEDGGNVTLTGDGGALQGRNNNLFSVRNGSYTLTGVASFDPRFFGIGTTGHLVLAGAYQVTGDTVQAGYGISVGSGKTINNTGVTSFNGLTGNVSLTGDGGAIRGASNNRITALTGGCGITGLLGIDCTKFNINSNGIITGLVATTNCDPGNPPTNQTDCIACGGQWQGNVGGGGYCVLNFNSLYTGIGGSADANGNLAYLYLDIAGLPTVGDHLINASTDWLVYYDQSETGAFKTKKINPAKIIVDQADLFVIDADTPAVIDVIPYEEFGALAPQIKFKIPAGEITASATGFARANAVYSYVLGNTVTSIGGCTGAFTITGTAQEVTVTTGINCRNIVIGLPDNVSIPYLSGTGATFTETVRAKRFVGTMDGGYF